MSASLNASNDFEIKNALLSVYDKTGIVELAKTFAKHNITLIASGGTFATLEKAGLGVIPLEKVGHFPEMLDGRVKTLQPEIFAGILARKDSPDHMKQISDKGIKTIDLVVSNFYDFEQTVSRADSKEEDLIEMIDIGGPSIMRASAKNFNSVCVVPSPKFYGEVAREIDSLEGRVSLGLRRKLSVAAFEIVASYDIAIYNTLSLRMKDSFPSSFYLSSRSFEEPKYGENPDQKAMIYAINGSKGGLPEWKQLAGEARSYNNYLDVASSYEILEGFEMPAAATVKHGQISGFAFSTTLDDSYRLAHSCDPEADFGNTTVFNRRVDRKTAELVGKNDKTDASVYTEIVLAPGYDQDALEILKSKQKKKIRIIEASAPASYPFDVKVRQGLALVQQSPDYSKKLDASKLTVETRTKPAGKDTAILLGLWEVVRRVESNGVVIGNGEISENGKLEKLWTLGVGSFRKRNGATKIALENAGTRAAGSYCASDGFFPFPDSIELLARASIKAIIQPGGSQNDKKVVETCDRYSIPMLFTHERAFKH